jgi:hypothetical protein
MVPIFIGRGEPPEQDAGTRDHAAEWAFAGKDDCREHTGGMLRLGTNPDDRNRNRDTQTKCAENRRDEIGQQAYAR